MSAARKMICEGCRRLAEVADHNEHLVEALESLLGDRAMAQCLWGDLPDGASMNITINLGTYRKAQAAVDRQPERKAR